MEIPSERRRAAPEEPPASPIAQVRKGGSNVRFGATSFDGSAPERPAAETGAALSAASFRQQRHGRRDEA